MTQIAATIARVTANDPRDGFLLDDAKKRLAFLRNEALAEVILAATNDDEFVEVRDNNELTLATRGHTVRAWTVVTDTQILLHWAIDGDAVTDVVAYGEHDDPVYESMDRLTAAVAR
ncbi:hypothetical protein [Citricoccus sp.]|uniref:hypothetical protein n=1 Tax=Citricoccus sp. TaxID=1978372 RepID=UPI002C67005F|nr:hypothetical protein [Citricoccus sp.]HRO95081.1 hypothetical protein [Citricoccus sp.]